MKNIQGAGAKLNGEVSIRTLSDAVILFINEQKLNDVDTVGSSIGARLVLELARRGGVLGGVISLDPGGFWQGWQRHFFYRSIWLSIRLIRPLKIFLPKITGSKIGRTALFPQFSPRPWRLSAKATLDEMPDYISAKSFDELLSNLA